MHAAILTCSKMCKANQVGHETAAGLLVGSSVPLQYKDETLCAQDLMILQGCSKPTHCKQDLMGTIAASVALYSAGTAQQHMKT